MSVLTADEPKAAPPPPEPPTPAVNYLNNNYGIWSWLLTTDHKRIGILYLVSITVFFTVGGLAAGTLVGILAERDLLLAATRYLQAPVEVAEIMHRTVVTATPEMPINEAARLMAEHSIGGLPVLENGKDVVGIITETDILRTFAESIR